MRKLKFKLGNICIAYADTFVRTEYNTTRGNIPGACKKEIKRHKFNFNKIQILKELCKDGFDGRIQIC